MMCFSSSTTRKNATPPAISHGQTQTGSDSLREPLTPDYGGIPLEIMCNLYSTTASAMLRSTPLPCSYMTPRSNCAIAFPCSAPFWYNAIASA
jgi:hypothetical protein